MTIQNVSLVPCHSEVSGLCLVNNPNTSMPKQLTSGMDFSNPVDEFIPSQAQKQPSTAKKLGIGFASVMLPGLGQFINGDTKKGFGFLASYAALKLSANKLGKAGIVADIALGVAASIDAIRNIK